MSIFLTHKVFSVNIIFTKALILCHVDMPELKYSLYYSWFCSCCVFIIISKTLASILVCKHLSTHSIFCGTFLQVKLLSPEVYMFCRCLVPAAKLPSIDILRVNTFTVCEFDFSITSPILDIILFVNLYQLSK